MFYAEAAPGFTLSEKTKSASRKRFGAPAEITNRPTGLIELGPASHVPAREQA